MNRLYIYMCVCVYATLIQRVLDLRPDCASFIFTLVKSSLRCVYKSQIVAILLFKVM